MSDNEIDIYDEFNDEQKFNTEQKKNFYHSYTEVKKEYPVKNKISDYLRIKKIEKKCKEFFDLSNWASDLHRKFYNEYNKYKGNEKDDLDKRSEAERYMKTSETYLMLINNMYLNPINNRITQLKANLSISGAIFSILLAILFQFFQNYSVQEQREKINKIYEYTQKQEITIKEIEDNINNIYNQNKKIIISGNEISGKIKELIDKLTEKDEKNK